MGVAMLIAYENSDIIIFSVEIDKNEEAIWKKRNSKNQ